MRSRKERDSQRILCPWTAVYRMAARPCSWRQGVGREEIWVNRLWVYRKVVGPPWEQVVGGYVEGKEETLADLEEEI